MALHRLTRIVMGVPNVAEVSSYYREFGLSPASEPHHFATVDGGEQLRIVPAVSRRLVQLGVGTTISTARSYLVGTRPARRCVHAGRHQPHGRRSRHRGVGPGRDR
jgi:hypothetical protein